jgi:hypothetical protein
LKNKFFCFSIRSPLENNKGGKTGSLSNDLSSKNKPVLSEEKSKKELFQLSAFNLLMQAKVPNPSKNYRFFL